ncbi:MAG: gluconate 2-dehydrogenase cytochrome c subunit [Gammaproteobacteria bacterium]|nr:gluconate 2-dehydrogenase cytochrome c subunit [Gammaproteobacteria bacterium]
MNGLAAWLPVILAGLTGCSVRSPAAAPGESEEPAGAERGARIYSGNCIACHQQDARGIPGVYPSLVGSPVVLGNPAEMARWVVKGQRPPSLPAGRYPTAMPRFGWMKPEDAAVLFTYLRSGFGNTAPPVDAAAVARALGESP